MHNENCVRMPTPSLMSRDCVNVIVHNTIRSECGGLRRRPNEMMLSARAIRGCLFNKMLSRDERCHCLGLWVCVGLCAKCTQCAQCVRELRCVR